jgi:hypothetical protein
VGERAEDKRSAMRSAAELLGAHARMRVLGFLGSRSWRMASTTVTVFPVPGLMGAKQIIV